MVDDEDDIAISIKLLLDQQGYNADAFTSAKKVLSEFKAGMYKLALLDVRMKEMNGFELNVLESH